MFLNLTKYNSRVLPLFTLDYKQILFNLNGEVARTIMLPMIK